MKTICAECGTELTPIKNEVTVVEMLGKPPRATKIWNADMWGCPKMGMQGTVIRPHRLPC